MSYVFAFVGFALLILLHEFGHFAAAKAVGMRVERFSLFFGPPIARRTRGETEYRIGVIPLGGYVRITGMNPYEELHPDIEHRAFLRQPAWKRITVIAAGPAVNLLIFFLLIFVILWSQGLQGVSLRVGSVVQGSPAAHAGLLGERIVSIDGVRGFSPPQTQDQQALAQLALIKAINRHRCAGKPTQGCRATTPVRIVVATRGPNAKLDSASAPVLRTRLVYPHYDRATGRMLLGFSFALKNVPIGPVDSASRTLSSGWSVTTTTVSRLANSFTSAKDRKQFHSVVGAYEITRQELTDQGLTQALETLALISLSLAIINLFPFLPLDGGHIAWAIAEKIRGRAIPFKLIERASAVGFVLILFIFLIGLSNDIGDLTGSGFGIQK